MSEPSRHEKGQRQQHLGTSLQDHRKLSRVNDQVDNLATCNDKDLMNRHIFLNQVNPLSYDSKDL